MTSSPGEGWHPDPDGVHQLRYHDGIDWTVHVANAGAVSQAARVAPPPPPPPPPEGASARAASGTSGTQLEDDGEWFKHLALEYSAACLRVFDAMEAALEAANKANGARNMANVRPQHEISIRNFTNMAKNLDHEFGPLYQAFQWEVAKAKEASIKLAGASTQLDDAETWLLTVLDLQVYSEVCAAVEYLRASYGPTPQMFLDGVGRANQLVTGSPNFGEPGFRGSIYAEGPPGITSSL